MKVSKQNDTFGPNCCSFKSKGLRLSGFRPIIFLKLRPNLLVYRKLIEKTYKLNNDFKLAKLRRISKKRFVDTYYILGHRSNYIRN